MLVESHTPIRERDPGKAFHQFLQGITQVLERATPDQWWKEVYTYLKQHQAQLDHYPENIREELEDDLAEVFAVLRSHADYTAQPDLPEHQLAAVQAKEAEKAMKAIAHLLLQSEQQETEPLEIKFISMEELLRDTKHFQLATEHNERGEDIEMLKIYSAGKDTWYSFLMPQSDNVYHKGGCSRVVLKILAGAPLEIIEAELPPNDIDMITTEPREVAEVEAARMGVDLKSMEMVKAFDAAALCKTRDVGLNMAFLNRRGLVYAQAGFEEARTGKMVLHGDNPGIYGKHTVELEPGVRLAKPSGLARLLKTVCEGKALSFDFTSVNEQVDFGTQWLYLAGRKFINKPNRAELLNRLYYLGKQLGQVRPDEANIMAVLERVHQDNPGYSVIETKLDNVYLVRWLNEKFTATLEQHFREKHQLGHGLDLERRAGDTAPYEVSLADYVSSAELNAQIDTQWEAFLKRCQQRTTEHMQKP